MKTPTITQEQIRLMNRTKILGMLREKGVMTKQELALGLQLSHTTINTCIQLMLEEGLVETVGMGKSVGGRKPAMIALVKEARYFFGVYIAPDKVKILLVNLLGEEMERQVFTYTKQDPFEQTLDRIRQTVWNMVDQKGLPISRIAGVGMSFPGVVHAESNLVEYAPNLGLRRYCFDDFQEKLGLKLYLENESVAATYAEKLLGKAKEQSNIVYISVAEGIGTGIIINNRIYKDKNKKAGDFGHVKIMDEGRRCNCGREDCWELYASKTALLRYYAQEGGVGHTDEETLLAQLTQAYHNGEEPALRALEIYTRFLFRGIEIILLAISPDEVIVGGDLGCLMQEIIRLGVDKLKINSSFFGYETVPIRVSAFGENGAVIGSALLPLEEIYDLQSKYAAEG